MQTSFDWSRNCKRFYFNVELPQDQDMGTSLIHTSIFEFPINSFGCEVTSWWHYITSRERVKYHAYFPCMCHTYFTTYSLLLWLKEKDCTREESDTSCDRNFKGWVLIGLQLFVTTSELPNFRSCGCCGCCGCLLVVGCWLLVLLLLLWLFVVCFLLVVGCLLLLLLLSFSTFLLVLVTSFRDSCRPTCSFNFGARGAQKLFVFLWARKNLNKQQDSRPLHLVFVHTLLSSF